MRCYDKSATVQYRTSTVLLWFFYYGNESNVQYHFSSSSRKATGVAAAMAYCTRRTCTTTVHGATTILYTSIRGQLSHDGRPTSEERAFIPTVRSTEYVLRSVVRISLFVW